MFIACVGSGIFHELEVGNGATCDMHAVNASSTWNPGETAKPCRQQNQWKSLLCKDAIS
jgi:hypothetical protein